MAAADDQARAAQRAAGQLFVVHPRSFETNVYVYPVVSRRSGGVSIGVNLNPDKVCNFDCVYCQVDRATPPAVRQVDEGVLRTELEHTLELVLSGRLFEHERFRFTPPALRRLNDIAFSGDGEPTTYRRFAEVVEMCAEIKVRRGLGDVKLVLITNATRLHRPAVARGVDALMQAGGEIWAKLEAGKAEYYDLIERTKVPFKQVLANIQATARRWPVTIQAMFLRYRGAPPPAAELEAFCDRLNEIVTAGGTIELVQVYTVARQPAETFVAPLDDAEVDNLVALVARRTGLRVQGYYGAAARDDEGGV